MKLSGYRIKANKHRATRILDIKKESPTVKTFTFKDKICARAKPGQFLMLWIPDVDEIPLSILDVDEEGNVSVAVKKVGEATRALHNKGVGDFIGLRGPFGNSFTLKVGKILVVGGGIGMAPLFFLAKKLAPKASKLTLVVGAKTREELLFMEKLKGWCKGENLLATTDDGSYGVKGLASEVSETILTKEKYDTVYACGPEQMIRKVFETAEKARISMEASLERLMRCAIGLCGSCVIGKYRVCKDGPVFNDEQLREVKDELGISKRDFDGKRIPL
ncbi:MAG: dihydroorotate dehydrogenase electron transfer subunit [Candidatus Bathyarchaeota archaeon]|nr:dihydroorotate dehydrogenase electron transfer subunit [Candidatus Bathyarchaeota archaeon]